MENIICRIPSQNELEEISTQIVQSYKATYKNLMTSAYLNSLSNHHWVHILNNSISSGDKIIILESNKQLIGSLVYGRSDKEKVANLHAFYLLPDYIGSGFGHQLYIEAEKMIRNQQFHTITLEVLTGNNRAKQFYLNHGYSIKNTFIVFENEMELECYTMDKDLTK